MKVFTSAFAVEFIPAELSWIDKIVSWNPCNSELLPKPYERPCAYKMGDDVFIAHPSIVANLRNIA